MTWLELFFDLVFVVLISRLAHDLGDHLDGRGLATFCVQFAAAFWAWNAFTYHAERFESEGLETRAFAFASVVAVAAMAIWAHDGLVRYWWHPSFAAASGTSEGNTCAGGSVVGLMASAIGALTLVDSGRTRC